MEIVGNVSNVFTISEESQSGVLASRGPRQRRCNSNLILICIAGEGLNQRNQGMGNVWEFSTARTMDQPSVIRTLLYCMYCYG